MSVKSQGLPGTIAGQTFSTSVLNSNMVSVILNGGVPLIPPGSFTMGNNGAITLGTALNKIYPNCYVYMLAGDVAAGVPASAGWYFAQFSSTTAGTVFNNNWNGTGMAPLQTSPTAFSTTGPGARTGDTGAETFLTLTIPVLTTYSAILVNLDGVMTNSAGAKTWTISLGGTAFHSVTSNSTARAAGTFIIRNTGATNKQIGDPGPVNGFTVSSQEGTGTVDTSATTSLTCTITRGTATDNIVIMPPTIEVIY